MLHPDYILRQSGLSSQTGARLQLPANIFCYENPYLIDYSQHNLKLGSKTARCDISIVR
ncbi:hypothetical protein PSSHI_45020 [Photobacterium sp. R1]